MPPFGGSIGIGENSFIPSLQRSFPHDRTDDKKKLRKVFLFITLGCLALMSSYCSKVPPEQNTFSGVERPHCMESEEKIVAKTGDSNVVLGHFIEPTLGQLVIGFVSASRRRSPRNNLEFNGSIPRFISRAVEVSILKNCLRIDRFVNGSLGLLLYLLLLEPFLPKSEGRSDVTICCAKKTGNEEFSEDF